MRSPPAFPTAGFALLGILSLAAAAIFVGRAVAVAATAERMWSAAILALLGTFWLIAYWSARNPRTR
jgi:1,4-dihydroxy-2-naphthoate octaprenyltransferase